MAEDYRASKEWQALNRIWKAVPAAAREGVKEDFRLITERLRQEYRPAPVLREDQAVPAPALGETAAVEDSYEEENYLAGLSAAARRLALSALTKDGFNLYACLMRLISQTKAADADELWDAYVSQHDAEEEQEEPLREIMELCLRRARERGTIA